MVEYEVPAHAFVHGNPGQLERLLRNLIDNATRHAATKVTATIRVDSHVILEVLDDGPGIPVADVSACSNASPATTPPSLSKTPHRRAVRRPLPAAAGVVEPGYWARLGSGACFL
ncbi:ATP-binding protein [Actinocrispum sp. NPDC049592]|uniref:sensor histidine kinase n=1 Tax=Actinocrispum sp. NPDC049592 TaxID=3154835 RepID=UPI00342622D6